MKKYSSKNRVCKVEATDETLVSRGGMTAFVHYLTGIKVLGLLVSKFGGLRKSKKGAAVENLFKQVLCFFLDGTSTHVSYFDQLRADPGYAAAIENTPEEMASSHTVKRFFKSVLFSWTPGFRWVLRKLFVWRLKLEQPRVIEMTVDTMVMDNDEAEKREGVQPTYKKKKGFQPLHLIWNGKIVDAVFRGGKKHGNSGKTVLRLVSRVVEQIRKEYCETVTIIIRLDSGFYDQVNFEGLDELNVVFVAAGKMSEEIKEVVGAAPEGAWEAYSNGRQEWQWLEFEFGAKSWTRSWRAIYTRPVYEDGQMLFEFARPENVILTNLGANERALEHCTAKERRTLLKPETIIEQHHMRGADELPHRGLKEFGFEQLPFKRFAANNAFYYCMVISYFLFETYKEDVLSEVIPVSSYANTVRRRAVDFAAKVTRHAGEIILNIPRTVLTALHFARIWQRCNNPPPIPV